MVSNLLCYLIMGFPGFSELLDKFERLFPLNALTAERVSLMWPHFLENAIRDWKPWDIACEALGVHKKK